jgi:hypothetical protein
MSWSLFKSNVLRKTNTENNENSVDEIAKIWTEEYDAAIKRGQDIVNLESIQQGNKSVMETLIKVALLKGLSTPQGQPFSLISELGNGVKAYWTGAQMNVFPIPLIPAPGSIQNISVISNIVTNPGTWPPQPALPPNDNNGLLVDQFILAATIHLTTVSGLIQTTSLYPSVPAPAPAPGVIPWVGYLVPPATPSFSVPSAAAAAALSKVENTPDTTLSSEQRQSFELERVEADNAAKDTTLPADGREAASDYASLKSSELQSGQQNAADVDLTEEEVDALVEISDAKCPAGLRVVAAAKKDIGILETGTPPGKNYGGFPGGTQKTTAGRIDTMMKNTGLDNQSKVKSSGEGFYWCAGAVTTWWKEAGLPTPKGAAACQNWVTWAKTNGYWSTKPVVGAAVLYGKPSHAHHIGIVSSILPNGSITTIEGNTSGGGFNRNGCGCFSKTPKLSGIIGYVIPPECVV